ncbi:MAG: Unknown protein [uncultured Sulfurovum sp.]|uniref:ATPase AAA-type core domain-containing protein n=1 Tax=uncultured Sulfurovum sp. TaxID=269237 RepID=A0A6S6UFY2_9BACT|nr:MAG: Unknown protein [uncultured Sulfurovum sp.]
MYLWVEDYKNIHKQGFNFSPRFNCKYNEDSNELTIDKNEDYIENFFGDNINVTAIVGKNGSGKSTLLEIIALYKFELKSHFLKNTKLVLVYEEDNVIYPMIGHKHLHDYILLPKQSIKNNINIKVKTESTSKNLFILSMFSSGLADFSDQNNDYNSLKSGKYDQFYNGLYISYQNPEESIRNIEQYKKYTDCLLKDSHLFDFFNEKFIFDGFKIVVDFSYRFRFDVNFEDLQSKLVDLHLEDSIFNQRTLADIYESQDANGNYKESYIFETKKLNFFKYISLYFLDELLGIFTNLFSDFQERIRKELIFGFISRLKNNINNDSKRMTLENYIELLKVCTHELEEIREFVSTDNISSHLPYIEKEFYEYYYDKLKILKHYKLLYEIYNNLISENQSGELNFTSLIYQVNESNIKRTLNKINKNNFIQDLYQQNILKLNYINTQSNLTYNFLSTGEKQFFNFLVNFTYTVLYSPNDDLKHMVIFLDEVDLSLHPKWQKELFNALMSLLNKIKRINSVVKIHLIITSHSPFLLSDIPKKNVVFLHDGVQDKGIKHKQTFGQNIHTLLSDSFFMDDGLMGEFAKEKINEVIKQLSRKGRISKKNKEFCKSIIEIVGEPFLKSKLEKMYEVKFPKTQEEKIAELKAELERLENGSDKT